MEIGTVIRRTQVTRPAYYKVMKMYRLPGFDFIAIEMLRWIKGTGSTKGHTHLLPLAGDAAHPECPIGYEIYTEAV